MESFVGLFISSQWEVKGKTSRPGLAVMGVNGEGGGGGVLVLNRWTTKPCVFREIIWDNLAKTD